MLRVSTLSTVYLRVPVSATVGGQPVAVTDDPVSWAFTAVGASPGMWYTGDWEGQSARILIGPGGTTNALPPREYWVWLRVVDSPESIAEHVDTVAVY